MLSATDFFKTCSRDITACKTLELWPTTLNQNRFYIFTFRLTFDDALLACMLFTDSYTSFFLLNHVYLLYECDTRVYMLTFVDANDH